MKIKVSMNQFLRGLGVFFLFVGAGNATFGNVSGGVTCFATGILLILLFSFEVKQFNVFGLAAVLREKITEADKILESLRGISLPVSEIAIQSASQAGRYDKVVPRQKLYEFVKNISRELKDMDVSAEQIERVREEWYLVTAIDMSIPIHQEIRKQIDTHRSSIKKKLDVMDLDEVNYNEEEKNELSAASADIEWNWYHYNTEVANYPNYNYKDYPRYFKKVISDLNGLPGNVRAEMLNKVSEHIEDIEYLINHKDIRRPDVWFK